MLNIICNQIHNQFYSITHLRNEDNIQSHTKLNIFCRACIFLKN